MRDVERHQVLASLQRVAHHAHSSRLEVVVAQVEGRQRGGPRERSRELLLAPVELAQLVVGQPERRDARTNGEQSAKPLTRLVKVLAGLRVGQVDVDDIRVGQQPERTLALHLQPRLVR